MALVKCQECGKEISSTTEICPNCGRKYPQLNDKLYELLLKKKANKEFWDSAWWLKGVIILIILLTIGMINILISEKGHINTKTTDINTNKRLDISDINNADISNIENGLAERVKKYITSDYYSNVPLRSLWENVKYKELQFQELNLINLYSENSTYNTDNLIIGVFKASFKSSKTNQIYEWYYASYIRNVKINSNNILEAEKDSEYILYDDGSIGGQGQSFDSIYSAVIDSKKYNVQKIK